MYSLFLRWKNPPKLPTKSRDGTSATSTNMNNLPQEIVDRICSYLDHNSLKSVLLISPNFQLAAELYSGGFQRFRLTTENIHLNILQPALSAPSIPGVSNCYTFTGQR
jgi:hypothetical protein